MAPHFIDLFLRHGAPAWFALNGELICDPLEPGCQRLLVSFAAKFCLERLNDGFGHRHMAFGGKLAGKLASTIVADLQGHGVGLIAPEILNGVYGATKAYVLAFSQSLHHELGAKGIRIHAVLPGAISTPFWDVAGYPVENLPSENVMDVNDLVDAALAGLEAGELATVPSLPDIAEWNAYQAARAAFTLDKLSRAKPAARYGVR